MSAAVRMHSITSRPMVSIGPSFLAATLCSTAEHMAAARLLPLLVVVCNFGTAGARGHSITASQLPELLEKQHTLPTTLGGSQPMPAVPIQHVSSLTIDGVAATPPPPSGLINKGLSNVVTPPNTAAEVVGGTPTSLIQPSDHMQTISVTPGHIDSRAAVAAIEARRVQEGHGTNDDPEAQRKRAAELVTMLDELQAERAAIMARHVPEKPDPVQLRFRCKAWAHFRECATSFDMRTLCSHECKLVEAGMLSTTSMNILQISAMPLSDLHRVPEETREHIVALLDQRRTTSTVWVILQPPQDTEHDKTLFTRRTSGTAIDAILAPDARWNRNGKLSLPILPALATAPPPSSATRALSSSGGGTWSLYNVATTLLLVGVTVEISRWLKNSSGSHNRASKSRRPPMRK